jgi:hypothetical protein
VQNRSVIPESGAIMRLCAAQTGMLGSGQEFIISEMLIGMTGDLVKITFGSNKVPSVISVFRTCSSVPSDLIKPDSFSLV